MELKQLKSFLAVANHLNFSRAAKELNTVQPAISRHITALEDELKTKLFFRTSREVSLTAAGEQLLYDANYLISQAENTKQAVLRAAQGKVGTLSIGYLGGAVLSFLPSLVKRYVREHSDVDVKLLELTAAEQIDALMDKRIDVSFSRPLPEQYSESYISKEIYVDSLVAVIPDDHPLAKKSEIDLEALRLDSFILFNREAAIGLYDFVIKECQLAGFSPRIVNNPKQMQTVLTHVASGLGISVVPSSVKDLRSNGCVFIPIRNMPAHLPLVMSYRQHTASPTTLDLVALIESEIEQIRQQMQL